MRVSQGSHDVPADKRKARFPRTHGWFKKGVGTACPQKLSVWFRSKRGRAVPAPFRAHLWISHGRDLIVGQLETLDARRGSPAQRERVNETGVGLDDGIEDGFVSDTSGLLLDPA